MKVKCIGRTEVPDTVTGIWSITTEGHPKYGYHYDTYDGFVVEASSYEQIVKWLKRKVGGDSDHAEYEWVVKLKGISYSENTRLQCILESYRAG